MKLTITKKYKNSPTKNNILAFIKNRWFLILVLLVFTILKIPHLSYPFYWDESWSYAPAVKLMYNHGPSLLPNAIDTYYSRGHPLFFYACAATWMKLFGASHISQHSFALFISLLLLVSVHEVCLRIFNKTVARLSLALVAVQVMFFVQSSLLLPEVMVALLSLITLYCYVTKKYIYTFICCTMLMLTKESGMVLGTVLMGHAALFLFQKKSSIKERIYNLLPVFSACAVTGLFFLLQRNMNGWYFYPEHTHLISLDWDIFRKKIRFFLELLFVHDSRLYLFCLIVLLSIVYAAMKKKVLYLLPVLVAIAIYIIEEDIIGILTRRALIPLLILMLYGVVSQLKGPKNEEQISKRTFIDLAFIYFIAYLAFSGINYFTTRYILCALVLLLILSAVMMEQYLKVIKINDWVMVLVVLATGGTGYLKSNSIGDTEIGIYDAMKVQEKVVEYFETTGEYNASIFAPSNLERIHLTEPLTGFLHSNKAYNHVSSLVTPNTEFIIYDNIEPDSSNLAFKKDTSYHIVDKIASGNAWAEIYKK